MRCRRKLDFGCQRGVNYLDVSGAMSLTVKTRKLDAHPQRQYSGLAGDWLSASHSSSGCVNGSADGLLDDERALLEVFFLELIPFVVVWSLHLALLRSAWRDIWVSGSVLRRSDDL